MDRGGRRERVCHEGHESATMYTDIKKSISTLRLGFIKDEKTNDSAAFSSLIYPSPLSPCSHDLVPVLRDEDIEKNKNINSHVLFGYSPYII